MGQSNNDRRKFLRQSVRAAAALTLPSFLSCGPKAQPAAENQAKKKEKIGVALVGLGYYSTDLLAPALQLTKHCELRGIVTGSPEKIPVWQDRYGIKAENVYNYDNFAEVADNDEIDVIYIVLPTALHAEYSIKAAQAGKHVWCEKPMAMDVVECQSVIDACQKAGVKLSIGYRMQHEPNTQTVMEYAEQKPFGNINNMIAEAGFGGSVPTSGWRSDPEMGGSALRDMGVYSINALRYASGMEPIAVLNATQYVPRRVDVSTDFELLFPGGVTAKGKGSIVENTNFLRVNCESGWYQLQPMQAYTGVVGERSDGVLLDQPIENQQARQMDDDALAIINDTPVMVPGSEGLKDVRITNAIIESAKTGKRVEIG